VGRYATTSSERPAASSLLSSWALYESGALHPDVELTGHFEHVETTVDLESIMREIDSARLEEAARQMRLQERG
jgi:RIO kinase 1